MQLAEFTPRAPGTLVTVPGGHAFLPQPLPEDLELPLSVWRASDSARGALGEFIGQSTRIENPNLVALPLLTVEAVESNRIEGTYTLVADVLKQHVAGPPRDPEEANRNLEVLLYRDTLWKGEEWLREGRPINTSLVKGLHGELLRVGRGESRHPGDYRQELVLIGSERDTPATARFVPAPPEQIGGLMEDLLRLLAGDPVYPPLVTCGLAHYQFETIHPFEDGNGRMGRLLIPLYLMAQGVIERPILYLSAYFETHDREYYDRLKRVSTHGEWEEWLLFFLEAVRVRAVDSKERVERLVDTLRRFAETVRSGTKSLAALAAVDLVVSNVYVTIPQLQRYANCSYGAAKTAVEAMQRLGILEPVPDLYPATWVSPAWLHEVYGV